MQQLFAVIRRHGVGWLPGRSLEEQPAWEGHANFMDRLYAEGFVVLAGPLGEDDAMIIVRAESPAEIEQRFATDPWTSLNLLVSSRVDPWTLRLGSLP